MSEEPLDEDVEALLDILSSDDEIEEMIKDEPKGPKIEVPEFIDHHKQEEALKPIPIEIKLDNDVPSDISSAPALTVDVALKAQQIAQVTQSVLENCTKDRKQAQEIIDIIMADVKQSFDNNMKPNTMLIEQLIKAVEVKSGIDTNAIKIAETNVKLIAATKTGGGINISNNNNSINASLSDILSQPFNPDEY